MWYIDIEFLGSDFYKRLRSLSSVFPLTISLMLTQTVSSNQRKFHNRLSETLDLVNFTVDRTFASKLLRISYLDYSNR